MRRGDRRAAPRLEMPLRVRRSCIVEGGNVARRASEKCERTVHALRKNRERRVKKADSSDARRPGAVRLSDLLVYGLLRCGAAEAAAPARPAHSS
jgi:hypothetical protein